MIRKITISAILVLMGLAANAQDPQFSQYYASPLYLNPAFAGTTNQHRIVLNHRLQWPTLPQTFATYALSYDFYKPDLRSGFGLLMTTDKAGSAGLRSTNVGAIYSYKIAMPGKWVFTPGLYFGYGSRSIDFNKLVFGDQIEFDQNGVPSQDPVLNELGNTSYFDSGFGLLFYNSKFWIGGSWWHINRPNISFLDREDRIPSKYTIHGGAKLPLYSGPGRRVSNSYLTPSFVYRLQGQFSQLDLGVNYHVDPVHVGIWYRGLPLFQNVAGNTSRDAIVFIIGLQFSNFELGYSYDFTISELGVNSGGAHEISIVYRFDLIGNPYKVKKKDKLIPCPSFIPKGENPFRRK